MLNGYYIVDRDMSIVDGVSKKIIEQSNAFNSFGANCKIVSPDKLYSSDIQQKILSRLPFLGVESDWKSLKFNNLVDFVYIRKPTLSFDFFLFLRRLKNQSKVKCVIVEFPTFPYDKEYSIKQFPYLLKDKFWRKNINKYIDYISTYSKDNEIYNVPCINIINGIDFSKYKVHFGQVDDTLQIVLSASMRFWHGYERIINGLSIYYSDNPKRKVFLHFVGEGPELEKYKNIVKNENLDPYIKFYGKLDGEEYVDAVMKCNIAAETFGAHRKNLYLSSSLKSREYLAMGLPIITSCEIDVIIDSKELSEFVFMIPADESPVDIGAIIEWIDNLYNKYNGKEIGTIIRNCSIGKCDIQKTVFPIFEKIVEVCESVNGQTNNYY